MRKGGAARQKMTSVKLNILWVDLKVSENFPEAPPAFYAYGKINIAGRLDRIGSRLRKEKPDVICFDFDYPDRAGLQFITELKQSYPTYPMVMVTKQHSEELATWAFRSRLVDFLVKPVSKQDLDRCFKLVEEIISSKREQTARIMRTAAEGVEIPQETPHAARNTDNVLLPALEYVERNFRHKISSEHVSGLCSMSSFRFSRTFKEKIGISFRDYVVRYRLREAYRMLENPQASVTDVAFAVGFNDVSYFSRMFKKHLHVSPSELNSVLPDLDEDNSPTVQLRLPKYFN